jgi:flagellum-specific ATP synthase
LADAGHYPAIDIEASISRAMNDVTTYGHQDAARSFKHLYSIYQQNRDLISVGAYESGSDEQIDIAISAMPALSQFLQQDMNTRVTLEQSMQDLETLFPAEDVNDKEIPEGLNLPQSIEQ